MTKRWSRSNSTWRGRPRLLSAPICAGPFHKRSRREDTDRTQPGLIGDAGTSELLDIVDVVELRPPIVEAAEDDPRAEIELFRAEAAAGDGARRAGLLVEVAQLEERLGREENNPAGDDLALTSARAAFAGDPASVVAFWTLQRLLGRARRWAELAEVHAEAARARPTGSDPTGRADLLVARGRLLEDRLERGDEALAAYREALAAVVEHPGALLALWLAGVRRNDAGLRAEALAGLSRIADAAPRRGALVVEEARAWQAARADGAARALAALEGELARNDRNSPLATLLAELDGLTRGAAPPDVADRALAVLGERIAAADVGLAVALWRERAHLLRRTQSRPQAALEALDEAARLDPAHPAVAAERIELALALDRGPAAAEIVRDFIAAAARDDDAVDVALLFAEISGPGEAAQAAALLEEPRVLACRRSRVDLRAAQLAIAVRNHDPAALAEAFAGEAEAVAADDGPARVHARDRGRRRARRCAGAGRRRRRSVSPRAGAGPHVAARPSRRAGAGGALHRRGANRRSGRHPRAHPAGAGAGGNTGRRARPARGRPRAGTLGAGDAGGPLRRSDGPAWPRHPAPAAPGGAAAAKPGRARPPARLRSGSGGPRRA